MLTSSQRILVCPHDLAMGGSQLNALELAVRMQAAGHQVKIFAPPGVLRSQAASWGLDQEPCPEILQPSLAWSRQLSRLVRDWKPDVVHTYEWAPSLSAAWLLPRHPAVQHVATVLSMDVPDFLPATVPWIAGTEQLRRQLAARQIQAYCLPPVVETGNEPEPDMAADPYREFPGQLLISMACRMSRDLDKAAGVLQAIDAVRQLCTQTPVRLVLAGEGECLEEIRRAASEANAAAAQEAVVVLGEVADPRELYARSDLSLGMGSSALRAMAAAVPVVVQGADGYWKLLDETSLPEFELNGFYGTGGGGTRQLLAILQQLAADRPRLDQLGKFAKAVVLARYSAAYATGQLEAIYRLGSVQQRPVQSHALGLAQCAARYARFLAARKLARS